MKEQHKQTWTMVVYSGVYDVNIVVSDAAGLAPHVSSATGLLVSWDKHDVEEQATWLLGQV